MAGAEARRSRTLAIRPPLSLEPVVYMAWRFLMAQVRNAGRFVVALDLHDILIVMQDWGGPIGITLAARCRDRVRGLITGNT
jgi:pimeloyl-ACP methyl ester carboxylesterase